LLGHSLNWRQRTVKDSVSNCRRVCSATCIAASSDRVTGFRWTSFAFLQPAYLAVGLQYKTKLSRWGWNLKHWRARSRLYRSRFLQSNTHFLAFFEIYKICTASHRSKFKVFEFLQKSLFFGNCHRISHRF
jgi:hypothetical protein